MNDNDMSFLPEDYVERQIEQRTNLICISLFAVVLIGIIGAYVVTTRHRAEVRQERTKVNNAYAEAARRLEQLEELQQRKQQMMRKAQLTATLLEPVPRSFLLADLINRMPSTLSVLEFGLKTKTERRRARVNINKTALANAKNDKNAAPDPEPIPRSTITLAMVGVAPTDVQVAQYISALSNSDLLEDVNLVFSEEATIEDTQMRKFRIEMLVDPTADVRKAEQVLTKREIKSNPMKQAATPVRLHEEQTGTGGTGKSVNPFINRVSDDAPGEGE